MNKIIALIEKNVNLSDLLNAATITWQGMVAIFAVMAVIAILVFIFAAVSSKKK